MSGGDPMSGAMEADPLAPTIKSVPCPRCGETFLRDGDMHVHVERHKPNPELSREEREGKVHCPKGCGRWIEPGNPDWEVHVELCDGAPPLSQKNQKSAYRWWCEEHQFGATGPRPWGDHKREHHAGKEPVAKVEKKKKEEVMAQVRRMLKGELARLTVEKGKVDAEIGRIEAALRSLDTKAVAAEGQP